MSITYKTKSVEISNWISEIKEELNVLTKELETVEKSIPFLDDKRSILEYAIDSFMGTNNANTLSNLNQQFSECELELSNLYNIRNGLRDKIDLLTDTLKHIEKACSELYPKE